MDLTPRQAEVAALVARGWSDKRIAREVGCSARTVAEHVREASARIPGPWPPRQKLLVFILIPSAIPPADDAT